MQREKGVKRVEKRARKVNTGHLPFFNFKVFFCRVDSKLPFLPLSLELLSSSSSCLAGKGREGRPKKREGEGEASPEGQSGPALRGKRKRKGRKGRGALDLQEKEKGERLEMDLLKWPLSLPLVFLPDRPTCRTFFEITERADSV